MKIYIAGPMTGYVNYNRSAFNDAERQLRDAGYEPVNPAPYEQEGFTWSDYLKRDIPLMLQCDGVATLKNWRESKGAVLEVYVAQQLDITAVSVETWLECAG